VMPILILPNYRSNPFTPSTGALAARPLLGYSRGGGK
jgi:hypothetical protein